MVMGLKCPGQEAPTFLGSRVISTLLSLPIFLQLPSANA
jgi:hypothetical protein